MEDVSGGDDDDTVSDDNHNENLFQKNVVDYIRIRGNLADTYSDDEIHRAIGILRYILNTQVGIAILLRNTKRQSSGPMRFKWSTTT